MKPFCEVTFAVKTEEFFIGSVIPISIHAGEGINKETLVQLFINDQDMGMISTAPFKYYWNTKDLPAGYHTIKALYISAKEETIVDEQIINLLSSNVICPSEVIDIDGNYYSVVQIGNQCWMQENLRSIHYSNGDSLVSGINNAGILFPSWGSGEYFVYGNDTNLLPIYGYLYTWAAAMNGEKAVESDNDPIQGICPEGWHMPSNKEWRTLIDYVGGVEIAANKLKDAESPLWIDNLSETDNASGFSALPGGCNLQNNSFLEIGSAAYFYTSTETIPNHAYHIYLKARNPKSFILGHEDSKRFGYSVRCLKD